jgi:hypothetical protein
MKTWLYLIGLGIGSVAASIWIFLLVSNFILSPSIPEGEGLGFFVISIACILSTLASWFKTKTGGLMMIIAGAAFAFFIYITADQNKWLGVMLSGAPFVIGGILVALGTLPSRQQKRRRSR